jgi:hypothetical protein
MDEIKELYRVYKNSLKDANFGLLSHHIDVDKLEKAASDLYAFRVAYVKYTLANTTDKLSRESNQLRWYLEQRPYKLSNTEIKQYPGCLSFMYTLENDIIEKITA